LREAKDKDRATITFNGTMDGEAVEGTNGDDVPVVLGDKGFVQDFEDSLFGKKAGDKYTVPVTFPENYNAKELAGKIVDFEIEIKKVEESKPFELTDEFMKEKQELPDTIAELQSDFEQRIRDYIDNINQQNKRYITTDKLVENNEIEIPNSFFDAEIKNREENYKKKNETKEVPEEELKKIQEDATWATKRFLILSQLAKDLQIGVSDEEVDVELEKEAAQYNIPLDYYKKILNKDKINEKKMIIQENKVVDQIVEEMVFIEKESEETAEEA